MLGDHSEFSYWFYKEGIKKETCKKLLSSSSAKGFEAGVVGETGVINPVIRNNTSSFIDEQWIYNIFIPYVTNANEKAGWNFDIDWYESVQISKYELGEMYGWHTDPMSVEYMGKNHDNYKDKMRKLSLIALLSDNFEDGNLQVALQDGEKVNIETIELSLGSIVVFPSFTWHRVTPLTKGVRHSLSMWCLGPSFK